MTPRALDPFLAFPRALRAEGFRAAPAQTEDFLAAVGLLGPRSIQDVRRAAHAVFGPGPERRQDFDDIFDMIFLGRAVLAPGEATSEEAPQAFDAGEMEELLPPEEEDPSGSDATQRERLFARAFAPADDAALLAAFARALPRTLPRRRSRRFEATGGGLADPRRAFRDMARRDGEILVLPTRRRRSRQRRVLVLLDISGSMKGGTAAALGIAHAMVRTAERAEAFTLGTRLTRVTRALRRRDRDQALALASGLVADWDGGTRLGEALSVFLAVPRFASFARGALVIVVSDGLERGGPEALVDAMRRLRALAWRIVWLSPLASDASYRPETGAMRAILPLIDHLDAGHDLAAMAASLVGDHALRRAGAFR
ncbi:VWA domain-containing protein [Roseomonas fluvialis]|uniref:VWA domain-containing protein n=1 Tax=Roseomonas fluvialis TaxID=1750527 RepID=A0ABN6P7D5_9PROT|nr:VWA domain-containing protein [Roseomonas fluvialis]BDG74280.1 hypothetical protein Rmf_42090 [Roseomonas fluvialis]